VKLTVLFLVTLMLLSFFLATGCQSETLGPSGNKVYNSTEFGLTAEYPADWNKNDNLSDSQKENGIVVIFLGPKSAKYDYLSNIMIEVEDITEGTTAEEYADIIEKYILTKKLTDYTNLQEQTSTLSGLTSLIRTFTGTEKGVAIKYTQTYTAKNNTGYVITYASASEDYDLNYEAYSLVTSTFKLK